MLKVLRFSKTVVAFVLLLFIVLVVWGIFTAMSSSASYTLAQSSSSDSFVSSEISRLASLSETSGDPVTVASSDEEATSGYAAPSPSEDSIGIQNSDTSSNQSGGANNGNTANNTGNNGGSSGSGGSANNSTPPSTPATPAKTYYPAWDEWVVDGYWKENYIAATYGQRAIYGSVCNQCGANVSGFAVAHLKETHHSGYHEGIVGYEDYEISPARTERVWVDTSHWVTHSGYWA